MTKRERFLEWLYQNKAEIDAAPLLFLTKIAAQAELIFSEPEPKRFKELEFFGPQQRDRARLCAQCKRVLEYMKDGEWHTKDEVARATKTSPHAVSARFSDIKRAGQGSISRRRVKEPWLFEYRLAA